MALADVYDAMVSRRVYKQELSHDNAKKHIVDNAGKKFDPEVVAAFVARNEEFLKIAQEYAGDATGGIMDAGAVQAAGSAGL
jgi:HD-GYP domain-containing protein (c-di-GMP phosphodiesterase class II)